MSSILDHEPQKVMIKRTPEEDLWNHYFTSSKVIKNQIEQYGITSFETEILHKYPDNADAAFWHEQLHIMASSKNPLCLNKYYIFIMTAKGKFCNSGQIRSAETRKRMSEGYSKMSEQQKINRAINISAAKQNISEETRKLLSVWQLGKKRGPLSEQQKDNLRGKKKPPRTKEHCAAISKAQKDFNLKYGSPLKGKKKSPEHCAAMKAAWEERRKKKKEKENHRATL